MFVLYSLNTATHVYVQFTHHLICEVNKIISNTQNSTDTKRHFIT